MTPLKINLELPRELLSALDVPEPELNRRILELVVLELIREGRISSRKGAELLGLSLPELLPWLAQHELPYFSITPEELDDEVSAAASWLDSASA